MQVGKWTLHEGWPICCVLSAIVYQSSFYYLHKLLHMLSLAMGAAECTTICENSACSSLDHADYWWSTSVLHLRVGNKTIRESYMVMVHRDRKKQACLKGQPSSRTLYDGSFQTDRKLRGFMHVSYWCHSVDEHGEHDFELKVSLLCNIIVGVQWNPSCFKSLMCLQSQMRFQTFIVERWSFGRVRSIRRLVRNRTLCIHSWSHVQSWFSLQTDGSLKVHKRTLHGNVYLINALIQFLKTTQRIKLIVFDIDGVQSLCI